MPSVASINFCANSKTNRPKEKKNFKGGFLAMGASTLTSLAFTPVSLLCAKGLTSPSKNLTPKEIKTLNDDASDILNKLTNLAQKGVTIEHVDAKDYIDLPIEGRFSSWIKDQIPINSATKGKNAFFASATNQVIYNKNKLPLAAFHELGHAFNFNNSAFWKSMQKMRMPMMGIASIFTLIPAITKNHKAKEGEELTKKEKFVNGLRNASPFLAAGCYLPMVLEEGMATLRGNKWAKELFGATSDLANKVAKTNRFGFISYSLAAVSVGLATFVAKKVKDNSDEKRAQKIA